MRAGTSSRLAAAGSPGSFALVAATAPTASRTYCAARGSSATRTPIVSGLVAVQPRDSAAPGSASTSVYGPGQERADDRRCAAAELGDALEQHVDARGDHRRRLGVAAPLELVEPPHRRLAGRPTRRGRRRRRPAAAPACPARIAATAAATRSAPTSLDHPLPPREIARDRSPRVAELLEQRRDLAARGPRGVSSTIAPPGASTSRASRASSLGLVVADDAPAAAPSRAPPAGAPSSSSSRTYGGFETTRSNGPSSPSSRLVSTSSTSRPSRSAFSRASASASGETSVAVTRAPGCSSAIESAIAPLPVPTSTTRGASSPAIAASARSTTISVSGRGTSARASVCSVSRRKPQSPRT